MPPNSPLDTTKPSQNCQSVIHTPAFTDDKFYSGVTRKFYSGVTRKFYSGVTRPPAGALDVAEEHGRCEMFRYFRSSSPARTKINRAASGASGSPAITCVSRMSVMFFATNWKACGSY